MKIYDKVTIADCDIRVEYSEEVPDVENGNYIFYEATNDREILIHPECHRTQLQRVFLHEFFHAIFDVESFNQAIPKELEEVMVDKMAKAFDKNFYVRWKNPTR